MVVRLFNRGKLDGLGLRKRSEIVFMYLKAIFLVILARFDAPHGHSWARRLRGIARFGAR